MAKRTNRVAWGLGVVLPVALAGGVVALGREYPPVTPSKLSQIRRDFRRHLRQRELVIALARAGKLKASPNNFHLKRLPARYSALSDGGEIIVEKPKGNVKVFFFTFRGMLSGSNGFLYAGDDRPVMYEEDRMLRIDRLARHWFWVITED
jgi:hypothetical protein